MADDPNDQVASDLIYRDRVGETYLTTYFFDDPTSLPDAVPRASIELRTLVPYE